MIPERFAHAPSPALFPSSPNIQHAAAGQRPWRACKLRSEQV